MSVCESMWHMQRNKDEVCKKQTFSCKDTYWMFSKGKHYSRHQIYAEGFEDLKYLLAATDDMTNFVLAILIILRAAQVVT